MGKDTMKIVEQIKESLDRLEWEMDIAISDKNRGQKAAALRARKATKELEKLLLKFRKQSVKEIG